MAAYYKLDVRQYAQVEQVTGAEGDFTVSTTDRLWPARHNAHPRRGQSQPATTICPTSWAFPAKTCPKSTTITSIRTRITISNVAVIGGKNSAAIAALELWRHGARVTLIYRGSGVQPHVKYWIKPDIENRIKDGQIEAYFNSQVTQITPDSVIVETPTGTRTLPNDFVFALTGYHPDFDFIEGLGVICAGEDRLPICNKESLESNVPGIYLAGVIVAGERTSEIFIENGRFHGRQVAAALAARIKPSAVI